MLAVLPGCSRARECRQQEAVPSGAADAPAGTAAAQRTVAWEIEYTRSGGFAGIRQRLQVSSSGTLTAADLNRNISIEQRASSDQLSGIAGMLEKMDAGGMTERAPAIRNVCRDCFQHALTVVIDGREYTQRLDDLSLPGSPAAPLIGVLSSLLQRTLPGTMPGR
jgi:hypothetical protein